MSATDSPTLEMLIRDALSARLADTHVALVGEVQTFDTAAQTVDVQPVVDSVLVDRDGARLVERLPLLTSVPVAFPRAGGYFLSLPIAAGDTVLLVCADTAIGKWRETGRVGEPAELRAHDLSDAIAIPGVFATGSPLSDASSDSLVLGKDGGLQLKIDDAGETIRLGKDSGLQIKIDEGADLIHLGDSSQTDFVALFTALKTQLTFLQVAYDAHTHVSSSPGSPSGFPVPQLTASWPGTAWGSSKAKAE